MSTEGQAIGSLFLVFTAGGVIVAAIVWSLATWSLLRYRKRNDDLPVQTRGNTIVESVWTLAPLGTVIVLFVLTMGTLATVDASDPSAAQIDVTAFRWGWQAVYPATGRTIIGVGSDPAVMVVPVGQNVAIKLSSADVDHAFYVPAFLFKRDAIPGRPSTFEIRIDSPGSYPGACAEYCGIGHDAMPFVIQAVAPPDFQVWLAGGAAPGTSPPNASPPAGASPAPSGTP